MIYWLLNSLRNLKKIGEYYRENYLMKLLVIVEKTKMMVFNKKKRESEEN